MVVTSAETRQALAEPIGLIIDCVKNVLERTPPELASDIIDRGIVMTGGGAMLHGLDILITKQTNIPSHLAEDPTSCVARGTGIALDSLAMLSSHLTSVRKTGHR